jgi:hypothetical protein
MSRLSPVIAIGISTLILAGVAHAERQVASTERLKASFVFRFAHFVTWPAATSQSNQPSPLRMCVIARDAFSEALDSMTEGREIDGRTLIVERREPDSGDLRHCQLLFIGRDQSAAFGGVGAALRGMPVLTIGEADGFTRQGGMIHLYEQERELRFDVNRSALEAAGLRPSAQFLRLATSVAATHSLGD